MAFLRRLLFRSVLFFPIRSRTCSLVTFSDHFIFSILLQHHISKLCNLMVCNPSRYMFVLFLFLSLSLSPSLPLSPSLSLPLSSLVEVFCSYYYGNATGMGTMTYQERFLVEALLFSSFMCLRTAMISFFVAIRLHH